MTKTELKKRIHELENKRIFATTDYIFSGGDKLKNKTKNIETELNNLKKQLKKMENE